MKLLLAEVVFGLGLVLCPTTEQIEVSLRKKIFSFVFIYSALPSLI